jgi:hypothetical protein
MDILEATRSYERWMAQHIPIVKADLAHKHERMAESPFVFLRGTFYRWAQVWPTVCASLACAPAVPSVGDLHIENFGTWRDIEGRLVWGVNDVDEACRLSYANDLVRVATSGILAARHDRITAAPRELCDALLEGYSKSIEEGGRPVILAEHYRWLRKIALNELRDPTVFWPKFDALRAATGDIPHTLLKSALPGRGLPYRALKRVAGVGSLGRRRIVALATWHGGRIAREAKAWLPSAASWATNRTAAGLAATTLLGRAVRMPDPCLRFESGWIVRRLAPDCSRIELNTLPVVRDEERLLNAMGWEAANIHLGRPVAAVRRDLRNRPRRWLERAAIAMADTVETEWRQWVKYA